MMARVRGVTRDESPPDELQVTGSISTKTGRAPRRQMARPGREKRERRTMTSSRGRLPGHKGQEQSIGAGPNSRHRGRLPQ